LSKDIGRFSGVENGQNDFCGGVDKNSQEAPG
jgi:hypothetical protein